MIRHLLIEPAKMRRIVRWGGLSIFVGFGLIAGAVMGVPFGTFSGMMAVMYGACCGSFRGWDRDRGLWMLSVGFMVLMVPLYLVLAWLGAISGSPKTWWGIDMFLGTAAAGMTARLLLSVTVYNWRFSRPRAGHRSDEMAAPTEGGGDAGLRPRS